MSWILEEPLPTLLCGATAALLLLMVIGPTSRKWAWGTALFVAVGTGPLLFTEWLVVTDREQVEASLWAAADAVANNEPDALQLLIEPGATEVRRLARSAFEQFTFKRARIAGDLRIEIQSDQEPATAEARFTATARVTAKRQQLVHDQVVQRLVVQLVRRGDQWLFTEAAKR